MSRRSAVAIAAAALLLASLGAALWLSRTWSAGDPELRFVSTIAGTTGRFGEPFGIAVKGDEVYLSDGESGTIWRIGASDPFAIAKGLHTPSAIAFDNNDNLLVADSGSHTVKMVGPNGKVSLVAGVENRNGFADGDAGSALFSAPIGVALISDKIAVADTYNDRIRIIANGQVTTLAGSDIGFADGTEAKFDTPCGIAVWKDRLLVADTGNRRIRVVETDGRVWTLAGNGDLALKDGLLSSASFVQPTAIAVDKNGIIYVADGNAIRRIGGDVIPTVMTISDDVRGFRDGPLSRSRFNRPSGLAIDKDGHLLVADSDNRVVRRISGSNPRREITREELESLRDKPEQFRAAQPPRWPFDPPERPRDIAGTVGELRGEISQPDDARFHNGLDIAGGYGETARFIRDEKVLLPVAAANFGTLRELLRMPFLAYIHVRVGRDQASVPFTDPRFQFQMDTFGKIGSVRVPRGTRFKAGEAIGTLNQMNHVHLVAGRSGFELNPFDALILPGLKDTTPPFIESVQLISDTGTIETKSVARMTGKTRILMRAYDRADGNAARRRLGIYRAGYQMLWPDLSPLGDVQWTLNFSRMPPTDAIRFVYGDGSKSGATGETIFNYIVTNQVDGDAFSEQFFDASALDNGVYILRVFAADYFGNQTYSDTQIEVAN